MLKRLFSVVLVLGLTFMVAGPVLAEFPGNDKLTVVNRLTGLEKGQTLPVIPLERDELIQQAPPLSKPAEFCEDNRVRSGPRWYWGGSIFPGSVYWSLQDPGTACVGTAYTFEVTNAYFYAVSSGDAGVACFHAEVWSVDNLTDPGCPMPGSIMPNVPPGPSMCFNIPAGTAGLAFDLPLALSPYHIACVDEPYFITIVCESMDPAVELGIWMSDDLYGADCGGTDALQLCTWYTNVLGGVFDLTVAWYDPSDCWFVDQWIWSGGRAADENECHVPGICDWAWLHCVYATGWVSGWYMPSSVGHRDAFWQKWNAATPCTIYTVEGYGAGAAAYYGVLMGDPGFRISIHGPGVGGPGAEIIGQDFTTATLAAMGPFDPLILSTGLPLIIQGDYYVMLGRASWAGDGDTMVMFTDNSDCQSTCNSGMRGGDGSDNTFCSWYGTNEELWVDIYQCCAAPKTENLCEAPGPLGGYTGPDDWPTHGSNYYRTFASDMGVGDPCDIHLAWKSNTTRADMRFNNVSAVGGKVYCTDDQAIHVFDLATGNQVWRYYDPSGIITAGSMRNNLTVTGGKVYASGGIAQSFLCLDTTGIAGNGNLLWGRYYDSDGGETDDWLCAAQRFAVSAVVMANGTDEIVVFGDEAGCFWALNTADGSNYGTWGINPIDLSVSGSIFHSPAYDGGDNLYVATVYGDIYEINIHTGVATLIFSETDGDGFFSGCSYDPTEDMIYAASNDGVGGGDTPERFKIDPNGVLQWSSQQGASLYSPPTIGRKKVYFGIDYPNSGLLIVNKANGFQEYDFAVAGVGMVSNPTTLTCDNYMFAGDRNGAWSLLKVDDFTNPVAWRRHFGDFVWGTALIHHELEDKDYAVMSIWSDYTTGYQYGAVFCWEMHNPPRPMMEQLVTQTDIAVPFQTTMVYGESIPEAFTNWAGCADLNVLSINAYNVDPPAASTLKPKVTRGESKHAGAAEETADRMVGTDYQAFFDSEGNLTKRGFVAGIGSLDEESIGRHELQSRYRESKQRSSSLSAAADDLLRTQNVQITPVTPISGGTLVDITFDYDGTDLERSVDLEEIVICTDDPDFEPEEALAPGYQACAVIYVNYVGGCLFEWFEWMYYNGYEMWHLEAVHNADNFADGTVPGLDWGDGVNEDPMFDGGHFICASDGEVFQWTTQHNSTPFTDATRFAPNPAPMSGICGIDYADYVHLGYSVVNDWNGTPSWSGNSPFGTPPYEGPPAEYVDVLGDISWVSYVDTFPDLSFTYGTNTTRVEISGYDFGHGYGDFKLIHLKVESRYGYDLDDLVSGIFTDWDVLAYNANAIVLAPEVAGVAVWDSSDPGVAFGHLVMPAYLSADDACMVDGSNAFLLLEGGYDNYRVYEGGPGFVFDTDPHAVAFVDTAHGAVYTPKDPVGQNPGDRYEMFTWPKFNLPQEGSEHHLYCAIIGVDASTNDKVVIKHNVWCMAYRANKWAGFNRGDVNDDNCVDAIDKAWLNAVNNGYPAKIFPYDFDDDAFNGGNGDVNLDGVRDVLDEHYLMAYLMGTGPPPQGAWRFGFMP